ncbi:uncharacterized protein [Henckelia pumila]|uniref:uncharacterized protein n=1 Tax=Henckelia pumila TaxID=405737 RepID=UPI003C6E2A44
MAANYQQFGTNRSDLSPKKNNEANVSSLEQQLIELTSLVRWNDHPNLRYGNRLVNPPAPNAQPHNQAYRPPYPSQQQRTQIPAPGELLENIVKDLATNTLNFQQETRESIQNLNTQMVQLATAINKLEAQYSNTLPSQTVTNPRENASAITLRNGKELKVKDKVVDASSKEELCTAKRKQTLKGCQKVELGENISAVIQRKLPAKFKDPGMFSITCTIGNVRLENAMLDLGASIKVMPYYIYASLNLGALNKTGIVIQLADRYNAYPREVVEDVTVQVNNSMFPADFYVLDMENGDHNSPILLGRPFLKTSMTKIYVHSGTLTMEFDGEVVKFNIYDAMKLPNNDDCVYSVDIVDYLTHECFEFSRKYEL